MKYIIIRMPEPVFEPQAAQITLFPPEKSHPPFLSGAPAKAGGAERVQTAPGTGLPLKRHRWKQDICCNAAFFAAEAMGYDSCGEENRKVVLVPLEKR